MGTLENDKFLMEVEKKCKRVSADLKKQGKVKNQSHYKSTLKMLGLNIPSVDKVSKNGFSFDGLPDVDKMNVWGHIWENTKYHEVKTLALSFLYTLEKEFLLAKWSKVKKWMGEVENWAHADGYSSIIASLFEISPEKIRPQLVKWNKSKNPWERRISIVGLYYYSSSRRTQPEVKLVTDFIKPLVLDEDYYVQKGVGWTLRELGNVEPKKQMSFLKKNITKLSPIAFSTAIEKISKGEREMLKLIRKEARKK